jgi:hypothetical protein
MTWVNVGVAAVGIATSVASAASKKKPTSTQKVEFPAETRRLIQDVEFPLLEGALGEQRATFAPFLQGRRADSFLQGGFGSAPKIAQAAARRGAKTAGVRDLGPTMERLKGLQPEFIQALRELVLQRGAQTRSIVPPGFGTFLSPTTRTETSGTGPDAFETGFSIAGNAAKIFAATRS